MSGPYPKLQRLSSSATSVTQTTLETLRHHIERKENKPAAMRALAWIEETYPSLESGCDEIRASFLVPSWDIEARNWLLRKGFNMIVSGLDRLNAEPKMNSQGWSSSTHRGLNNEEHSY